MVELEREVGRVIDKEYLGSALFAGWDAVEAVARVWPGSGRVALADAFDLLDDGSPNEADADSEDSFG